MGMTDEVIMDRWMNERKCTIIYSLIKRIIIVFYLIKFRMKIMILITNN